LAMTQTGISWENNFILLEANATGGNSLQELFTYDASIGMSQSIDVTTADSDPVNPLTGTILITHFNNFLGNTCPATNNEQIISCVYNVAKSVPGFNWSWKLYDEPGCPNQSIGYCRGTIAGGNYSNIEALAQYIYSIDPTHLITGVNVGDIAGPGSGTQLQVDTNLFGWLATPPAQGLGWDFYPIPEGTGTPGTGHTIAQAGLNATTIASVIAANNPGMSMNVTLQAFSWYQEGGGRGCTTITLCPYPTEAQMQDERDQVLYYAKQANQPINAIYWYEWATVSCLNNYTGCSASANEAALKAAITAPFPAIAPSLRRSYPHKRCARACSGLAYPL
jgi:hypothetical protein